MNPILYDISEKNFTSHGLGVLECMSCFVEEERNGSYELEMKAALQGSHVADLSVGRIILAKPNRTDQPQPFRIYNLVKSLDQTIQVYARHISYDLSGRILSNISSSSCGATLSALASDPSLNNEWTFTTDRSAVSGDFSSEVPGSCRLWLGGRRGSVLDLYGPADWHFDRYTCEFLTSRGADRGVTIRYGKNLLAMKAAVDSSNVYSGVLCYYDSDGVVVKGTEVATGQTALQRTLLIDKTGDYTEAVPTSTQLTDDATAYVSSHNLTAPASNITLDWVQSGEIIDRIDLCDTVSVVYDDFGVSAKAKCIRTKWNVLEERYEEIEIGEVRTTLADTIASTNEQIQEAQQEMETGYMAAIRAASALITGAAGGYVVLWNSSIMAPADETHPANEILIMNDPDVNSATKVWRWNIDGLGYSNNGYAGPFQTAIDMNGGIATWFIDTVRINADNITAGTITGININGTHISGSSTLTVGEIKTIDGSDYSQTDLDRIVQIILGNVTPTTADYTKYDLYKDGNIDIVDWAIINEAINNGTASVDLRVIIDGEADSDELIKVGTSKIGAREIYAQNITADSVSASGGVSSGGNVSAGGTVTAEGHGSPIGTIITESLSTTVTITGSTTTVADLLSFELPAGTWVITGTVRFADCNMMSRQVATISQTANHYNSAFRSETYSVSGTTSQIQVNAIVKLSAALTTYYLAAGSAVSTTVQTSATGIKAVRIA